ncbi:MAG: L-2-amino-thiazoline-4-carboxylic acid hydrolase [Methanothrix sp.]|nr:L-2-amino-thiazoline-4-carboxylic acid hydrolase [Methanothrix sp.]
MTDLTERQKMEYFHRSYMAADGLWFMKVEEQYGFLKALQVDEAVWRVLPKIQARTIKSMMDLQLGLDGLREAIDARLSLEGFEFILERKEKGFCAFIRRCPWHDLMVESGRERLSEKVCDLICRVENSVWAMEFSEAGCDEIKFDRWDMICKGACRCVLWFGR